MVSEENIANIEVQLKFWDAVSRDDFDTASQLLSADYVEHAELPAEFPQNRQGSIQFLAVLRKAFPDAQFEIQNILSDGELVSDQVILTGTQAGELFGVRPTGKPVQVELIDLVRCANDQVVEHWGVMDRWALFQQLGVLEPQELSLA